MTRREFLKLTSTTGAAVIVFSGLIVGWCSASRPAWITARHQLSILFIVSAVAAGQSLTVLACLAVVKLRRRACVDRSLLDGVANFVGFTLIAYLYLRFWDSLSMTYTYAPGRTEGLQLLTSGMLQWNFWLGEIALGGVIPAILYVLKSWQLAVFLKSNSMDCPRAISHRAKFKTFESFFVLFRFPLNLF